MIYTKLMQHQVISVKFGLQCLRKYGYFGLFSDYGTGKTLCFLALVECMKFKRVLVVSTKTAIQITWPVEIRKHTNFEYVMVLGQKENKLRSLALGLRRAKQYTTPTGSNVFVFLINFDGVKDPTIARYIAEAGFDVVCVDESTKIKSPKTLRTLWLWELGRFVKHKCILSGFPATEGMHELYSQAKFLDGGSALGNKYWSFLNKCFAKIGMKWVAKRWAVTWITKKIAPFCIRVTNTMLRLPPAIYRDIRIPKTEKQKYLLDELNNYFSLAFGKVSIDTPYVFTLITKSLQICDGFIYGDNGQIETVETVKDEVLVDTLEEIDVRQNKVIIWCAFTFTLKKVFTLLKNLHYNPLLIKGDTENLEQVVTMFRSSHTRNVLVASLKKAHESITLTECKYAIYYSNHWSQDIRQNSEARIRRKGSEIHDSICYIDLITQNSVETKVHYALRNKKNLVNMLKEEFQKRLVPV